MGVKRLILTGVYFFMVFAASAQTFFNGARTDYDRYFLTRVGVVAGVGYSGAMGKSEYFRGAAIPGFSLGGSLDYPMTYRLIMHAELLYAQKGFEAATASGHLTQKAYCIDLPLLAKYRLKRFNLIAGAQLSHLLNFNYQFSKGFFGRDNYVYTGGRTFFSGVAGLSADINNNLELSGRYALDFRGVNINSKTYLPSYRNQSLQLTLNIKLN